MSRLTEKNDERYDFSPSNFTGNDLSNYYSELEIAIAKMLLKVGQLEDIEAELGIDLRTLLKALRNGVYVNNEHFYRGLDEEQNETIQLFECRLLDGLKGIGIIHTSLSKGREVIREYTFEDYGKTWALTREELQNE